MLLLKGLQFADVAEIQEDVTDEFKKVQKEEFMAYIYIYIYIYICKWSFF